MTDYSKGVVVEARKKRLSQSRDAKGDWYDVTFQLHPNDAMNTELAKWPLGTRVGLVITLIADDETTTAEPVGDGITDDTAAIQAGGTIRSGQRMPDETTTAEPAPAAVKGGPLARQAGILCNTPAFQDFIEKWRPKHFYEPALEKHDPLWPESEIAAHYVRWWCDVDSRAELDHNMVAAQTWKEITDAYYASQHGQGEQQADQRAAGPGG